MRVITNIENKYYFMPEDVEQLEEALTFRKNKRWLANQMGFTYKTLWSKLNHKDGAYFDQVEVEQLQHLLKIKFTVNE